MNNGEVTLDEIAEEVCSDFDLSKEEVKEIADSQFDCVEKTIAKGNFEAVRLPMFGLFHVKKSRLKYLQRDED